MSGHNENAADFSRGKKAVFTLILIGMLALICGVPGYLIFRKFNTWTTALSRQSKITPARPFYRGDAELGFVANPGDYVITETEAGIPGELTYRVKIEEDGSRNTGGVATGQSRRPEIWIFGCSFTWGQGLSDEQTFPYLVQQRFPKYKVKNFGENGYGTVHALIQLRRLAAAGRKPAAIVIAYIPWHDQRNVAEAIYTKALYWFSGFQRGFSRAAMDAASFYAKKLVLGSERASKDARFFFPQAYLSEDGKTLHIRSVPLLPESSFPYDRRKTEVTRAIFDEIQREAARLGVKPIVLRLWAPSKVPPTGDPLEEYFQEHGFLFQDATVDYSNPEWNLGPLNGHPNGKANLIFADRLTEVLRRQSFRE